jgi:hypothetical protein
MRVDLYTKSVLTIIAICLVWLCVRNASVASVAQAQGDASGAYQQVVIGGWVGGDGVIRILPAPATPGKSAPLPVTSR